jgi:crossover junction endodeoxyribonuclease RuvC
MKTILGIDPGLKCLGFGIIRAVGNKNSHIAHGVISTQTGQDMGKRLCHIYKELNALLKKYNPDIAVVESLYFARNLKSAIPVAQARGVILLCLAERGVEVMEYTPLQVKQSIVGQGRAQKSQLQEIIRIILGLRQIPRPDHASDALAVALCHTNFQQFKNKLKQVNGKNV